MKVYILSNFPGIQWGKWNVKDDGFQEAYQEVEENILLMAFGL